MTPERLKFCLEACQQRRRDRDMTAHLRDAARFLHISERTMRRWLSGAQPIPRPIEIIVEIFHAKSDIIDARLVDQLIAKRDEKK